MGSQTSKEVGCCWVFRTFFSKAGRVPMSCVKGVQKICLRGNWPNQESAQLETAEIV